MKMPHHIMPRDTICKCVSSIHPLQFRDFVSSTFPTLNIVSEHVVIKLHLESHCHHVSSAGCSTNCDNLGSSQHLYARPFPGPLILALTKHVLAAPMNLVFVLSGGHITTKEPWHIMAQGLLMEVGTCVKKTYFSYQD